MYCLSWQRKEKGWYSLLFLSIIYISRERQSGSIWCLRERKKRGRDTFILFMTEEGEGGILFIVFIHYIERQYKSEDNVLYRSNISSKSVADFLKFYGLHTTQLGNLTSNDKNYYILFNKQSNLLHLLYIWYLFEGFARPGSSQQGKQIQGTQPVHPHSKAITILLKMYWKQRHFIIYLKFFCLKLVFYFIGGLGGYKLRKGNSSNLRCFI